MLLLVLEVTRNWPFMYDLLHEHVQQVDLVHAKGVRAIANAAVKPIRLTHQSYQENYRQ